MSAADEGASSAVRFRCDAAGIHHDHIGGSGMTFAEPCGTQVTADCLAISARRPASEMFHMEFRHIPSLVPFPSWAAQAGVTARSSCRGLYLVEHERGQMTGAAKRIITEAHSARTGIILRLLLFAILAAGFASSQVAGRRAPHSPSRGFSSTRGTIPRTARDMCMTTSH